MGDFHRPFLVTIVGGLFALLGVLTILSAVAVIFVKDVSFTGIEGDLRYVSSGVAIAFGIVMIAICFGLLKGIRLIWYAAMILGMLAIVSDVYSIIMYQNVTNLGNAVSIVICVIIIYYLMRPNVREFFRI